MKNKDNFINDPIRMTRALHRRGIILGVSESFLVGLSFYLGFLLAGLEGLSRTFIPAAELSLMSLGAAFSYAFIYIFRKSHQTNCGAFSRQAVAELFKNISYTYLLHLAILFLFKDSGFSSVRNAIGLAYLLGFAAIISSRFALSHLPGFDMVREGRKTLIIKGIGDKAPGEPKNRIPEIIYNRKGITVLQNRLSDEAQAEDARAAH
jgi:hypothetical protein